MVQKQKKVRFGEREKARLFPKYTPEECHQVWYPLYEMKQMRDENNELGRRNFKTTAAYIRDVLEVYQWQAQNEQYSPERLRSFAVTKSSKDIERAHDWGKLDAMEVFQNHTSGSNGKKNKFKTMLMTMKSSKHPVASYPSRSSSFKLNKKHSGVGLLSSSLAREVR